MTFDRVRARMLEAKAASEEQIDAVNRAFDDPLLWFVDGAMVGAWGRKPAG